MSGKRRGASHRADKPFEQDRRRVCSGKEPSLDGANSETANGFAVLDCFDTFGNYGQVQGGGNLGDCAGNRAFGPMFGELAGEAAVDLDRRQR